MATVSDLVKNLEEQKNELVTLKEFMYNRYKYYLYAYVYGEETGEDVSREASIAMELSIIMGKYDFWKDVAKVKEIAKGKENQKKYLQDTLQFFYNATRMKRAV